MTDARVTQAPNLALAEGGDETRVTQAPALALAQLTAIGARLTSAPMLALLQQTIDELRISQTPVLVLAADVPCATHWSQTWCIERLDGTVHRYTDHDEAVVFQGQSFSPCDSLAASAAELAAFIGQIGSQDLAGIVADDGISEADLYNGLFDGATVEVWLVPWSQGGGQIPRRLFFGTVEAISQGQHGFKAEVLTPGAKLQQRALLKHYTPACRWTFGDADCAFNLAPLTVTGSVTERAAIGAGNRARHRIFRDSARAEAAGTFDQGLLTWTGGQNVGKSSEVKAFAADGSFTLWDPLLFEIALGDAYSVYEGCNKTEARCKELLHFDRFGGFPHVSGRDKISQTPDSK